MVSLSERWFRPKRVELGGRLYEWVGVVPFKRALMRLTKSDPSDPKPNAYALGGRSLDAVHAFELRTRRNELVHLLGLLLGLPLLALGVAGGSGPVLLAGALLVAANFHCFALQRYNRIRLLRLLGRARPERGES